MRYVIDCSFSTALFLPDEKSVEVRDFFIEHEKGDNITVPLLWWYETNNVLNSAIKRKRLKREDAEAVLRLFDKLALETDTAFGNGYSQDIVSLAQSYGLSSYDAVYLELAIRKKARLMSLDSALLSAAKKSGIETE